MLANARAVIGGNNPPTLREEIAARYADLLSDIETTVTTDLPILVVNDEAAAQVAAVGKDATALVAKLNAAHKKEKEPHLEAGREVDAWKNAQLAKLTAFLDDCKALVGAWQDQKEVAERKRLEEERQRLAAAAEAEAQRAMKAMTPVAIDKAAEAAEKAQVAETAANVTRTELARVAVDGKAVASRSAKWAYEVVDLALIPRTYLAVNDAVVRAHIATGVRDIPGVRIFQQKSTSFR